MRHVACLALVMAVAAGCAQRRDGHVYRVPSSAMEPTLHCARPALGCRGKEADRVFAVPYRDAHPAPGDIVVFEAPPAARLRCGTSGIFIKRVIRRVGRHRYVLLGDNRPSSCDSRVYGPVAESAIRGKVVEIKPGSRRIHLR
jgi:signal peptidase I